MKSKTDWASLFSKAERVVSNCSILGHFERFILHFYRSDYAECKVDYLITIIWSPEDEVEPNITILCTEEPCEQLMPKFTLIDGLDIDIARISDEEIALLRLNCSD